MSSTGLYVYGFTTEDYTPDGALRGLRGEPVGVVSFCNMSAIVSPHPIQPVSPVRANVDPHHRVIREIGLHFTIIPAAFGYICNSEEQVRAVLVENCEAIASELNRLDGKTEMAVKLLWNVPNIYDFLVATDPELKRRRDRVFRSSNAAFEQKLELGSFFEARLRQRREQLSERLLSILQPLSSDVVLRTPANEKLVLHAALLVRREQLADFENAVNGAAEMFDGNLALDYNGPRPPFSFVKLRLRTAEPAASGGEICS